MKNNAIECDKCWGTAANLAIMIILVIIICAFSVGLVMILVYGTGRAMMNQALKAALLKFKRSNVKIN